VLTKSSRDIAPAGSRPLTHVGPAKAIGGRLISAQEAAALRSKRVSVLWDPKNPDEWWEAFVGSEWDGADGWYKLDFDGFDTGTQFFDFRHYATEKRLRLPDKANEPPADGFTAQISDPADFIHPADFSDLCASGKFLHSRIASHWDSERCSFRGTVITCESESILCRYDDGDELRHDTAAGIRLLLAPPQPGASVTELAEPTAVREFSAGFELEYSCACEHGGQIWLRGTVVGRVPLWPSWYRVALAVEGSPRPVERELLLRSANRHVVWRRPGSQPQRGPRARSGVLPHGSISRSLTSPAPTWGRVEEIEIGPVEPAGTPPAQQVRLNLNHAGRGPARYCRVGHTVSVGGAAGGDSPSGARLAIPTPPRNCSWGPTKYSLWRFPTENVSWAHVTFLGGRDLLTRL
jgi:hypothetical protein